MPGYTARESATMSHFSTAWQTLGEADLRVHPGPLHRELRDREWCRRLRKECRCQGSDRTRKIQRIRSNSIGADSLRLDRVARELITRYRSNENPVLPCLAIPLNDDCHVFPHRSGDPRRKLFPVQIVEPVFKFSLNRVSRNVPGNFWPSSSTNSIRKTFPFAPSAVRIFMPTVKAEIRTSSFLKTP